MKILRLKLRKTLGIIDVCLGGDTGMSMVLSTLRSK